MEYLKFLDSIGIFLVGLGLLIFSGRLFPKSERNDKKKQFWVRMAGLGVMIIAIVFGVVKSMLPICFYVFGERVCWNEMSMF